MLVLGRVTTWHQWSVGWDVSPQSHPFQSLRITECQAGKLDEEHSNLTWDVNPPARIPVTNHDFSVHLTIATGHVGMKFCDQVACDVHHDCVISPWSLWSLRLAKRFSKRGFSGVKICQDLLWWFRNPITQTIHVWYIYIYLHENHKNKPNVGKYTIHGSYG